MIFVAFLRVKTERFQKLADLVWAGCVTLF